jgi:TetR/AcrR family transcriptional regulator
MEEIETISELSDKAARHRLLKGAVEIFTRKGYAATTVREIVAAAGVSKPVLYYYFHNKEGIYLELIKEAFTRFDRLLEDFSNGPGYETAGAREKLLSLADQIFSLFLEHIEVARLIFSIYYGPPQRAPYFDFDSFHFRLHDLFLEILEEGRRNGEFKMENPDEVTYALLGALNMAHYLELFHPENGLKREGLGRVLEIILKGISSNSVEPKGV